jgi:hypothetical protein
MVGEDIGDWALRLALVAAIALGLPLVLVLLAFAVLLSMLGAQPGAGAADSGVLRGDPLNTVVMHNPASGVISAAHAGLVPNWAEAPALNQFDRRNYETHTNWIMWDGAACSAASLAWILRAYGLHVPAIDTAIGWIGPFTGISPQLGLLDATGGPLARAITGRGLTPRVPRDRLGRSRALSSVAELKEWLLEGPLLMDGKSWFGAGHWFVAIGYDGGGVFIRDSSGYDNRYLSWSRLYGSEVGFDGWVVGVAGAPPQR